MTKNKGLFVCCRLTVCLLLLLAFPLQAKQLLAPQHYAYFARDREAIKYPDFIDNPDFEGAQIMYLWRRLEPEPGVYDFSEIRSDLKVLKAHQKKLWIQLQDATFSPQVNPVPRDMEENALYQGGAVPQFNEAGQVQGWVARRWDPQVQKRFQRLLCALGEAFDGEIAGINLQESAIEVTHGQHPTPTGFSPTRYRDTLLNNMQALKHCFQKSVVMQYANFMPGEWLPYEDQGFLNSVYQRAQTLGVAVGTPDLMPERKGQQNHAYKQMHQGHNVFAVAVQDGNYFGATGNPEIPAEASNRVPELYAYAHEYLRVRYMFWVIQEPFFRRDLVPFLKQLQLTQTRENLR